MNHTADNKKITMISLGILMILLIAVFLCWASTQPQALEDVKEITVTVAHSDDFIQELEYTLSPEEAEARNPYVLEFETTAKTLMEALETYALLELIEQPDELGGYITIVDAADGEYVDHYRGYAWFCYRNNEPLEETLDALPIQDGDTFYFYIASEN